MKKMLFIYNPNAGKGLLKAKLSDVLDIMVKAGYELVVYPTQSYKDAYRKVVHMEKGYDIVVCSGGDGTLDEVVTGMMKRDKEDRIPIGYIPTGSTNDFAQSAGIPFFVDEALDRVFEGEMVPIDVGSFNGRCFNYVASFGAFTAVSYNTPRASKNMFGRLAYIFEGIKDIGSIVPLHAKITTDDGTVIEGDYSFGAVGNSCSIGGVVHIPKDYVSMNDGKFEILLIKMPQNPNQLASIVHGLTWSDFSNEVFTLVHAKEITVESDGEFDWSLDGEFEKGSKLIKIKNMHNAVNFML